MKTYSFLPNGVCARKIDFEMDAEGRLHNVKFTGGCPGNLQAIGKLVEGAEAEKIAALLRGNDCGGRGTSCPDQLARALAECLSENA